MTLSNWKIFLVTIAIYGYHFFSVKVLLSQVIPDNSINTIVNQNQNILEITGGTTRGDNLFHSFQDFSIPTGLEAYFNNANDISNIFGRVTGGNISNIDGLIRANGNANLFLINPAGIVFTENAKLDIGGSFLVTTAEAIEFNDGEFSAIANEGINLTIGFPIGLGMGSNPGEIVVEGLQNNVVVEVPSFQVNTDNLPEGIEVSSGKNITLIGGEINFTGGGLKAPGGSIELLSIDRSETVDFISSEDWFAASLVDQSNFGNINLTQAAYLNVSSQRAGDINVSAQEIRIDEGSVILANTSLSTDNAININASESVVIQGTSGEFNSDKTFIEIEQITSGDAPQEQIDNYYSVSLIGADIFSDFDGTGNDININTRNLQIFDGGEIRTVNFSTERSTAGNINLDAENISVQGTNNIDNLLTSTITSSTGNVGFSLTSSTGNTNRGNGGDIEITTNSLSVLDGGRIKVDSFNVGSAGNLSIEAENILLSGSVRPFIPIYTGLIASSPVDDDSGNIAIKTNTLDILDGARISTATFGRSNAGEIDIEAESINVSGFIPNGIFVPSSIIASVELRRNPSNIDGLTEANPQAGSIDINTSILKIFDGAKIESVSNSGNAGDITINASNIELNGTKPKVGNFIGGISTSTNPRSFGNGGNIAINTDSLRVLNGSIIRAISLGSGDAGNISIDADTIEVSGVDRFAPDPLSPLRVSKINTGAQQSNGGNIFINSDSVEIKNLATMETSTNSDGIGGEIFINSNSVTLQNRGKIIANTQAGTGGNITIDSESILGIENSDITANAIGGDGGNISISSNYIFGLVARSETTQQSDITASSEFGVSGDIQLDIFNILTKEELLSLRRIDFGSSEYSIAESCFNSNTQNTGTIVNYGQNGIPENPENFFDGEESLTRHTTESISSNTPPRQNWQFGDPIVEANTVQTNPDGTQYLVAQAALSEVEDNICSFQR